MSVLILGLVLFLGAHSARALAEPARQRFIAARGAGAWKGLVTGVSLVGLALIVWGYALARQQPVLLWSPPAWTRHLAWLLTLLAFILLAASHVPGNVLKARLHHPMVLAVLCWALAHLLANRTLAAALLFGSFLAWAVSSYRAARQRDRAAGTGHAAGSAAATAVAVGVGGAAWAVFALWVHAAWLGVRPL